MCEPEPSAQASSVTSSERDGCSAAEEAFEDLDDSSAVRRSAPRQALEALEEGAEESADQASASSVAPSALLGL